jgi:hypothetical protein
MLLSRKATIDTMTATTMTRLVGVISLSFTSDSSGAHQWGARDRQPRNVIAPTMVATGMAASLVSTFQTDIVGAVIAAKSIGSLGN